jgi:hypothetical protein
MLTRWSGGNKEPGAGGNAAAEEILDVALLETVNNQLDVMQASFSTLACQSHFALLHVRPGLGTVNVVTSGLQYFKRRGWSHLQACDSVASYLHRRGTEPFAMEPIG